MNGIYSQYHIKIKMFQRLLLGFVKPSNTVLLGAICEASVPAQVVEAAGLSQHRFNSEDRTHHASTVTTFCRGSLAKRAPTV